METREKVLVALMVAAIGYGGFELFYRPAAKAPALKKTQEAKVEEARTLSTNVLRSIGTADLTESEKQILQAAATPWSNSPFYEWPRLREGEINPEDALSEEIRKTMIYSGYLEMGGVRIAVISGLEYQEGDMLPDGKFIVLSITPQTVTLGATTSDQQIIIPYEDAFIVE